MVGYERRGEVRYERIRRKTENELTADCWKTESSEMVINNKSATCSAREMRDDTRELFATNECFAWLRKVTGCYLQESNWSPFDPRDTVCVISSFRRELLILILLPLFIRKTIAARLCSLFIKNLELMIISSRISIIPVFPQLHSLLSRFSIFS